jgi:RNase P subunit RPR2
VSFVEKAFDTAQKTAHDQWELDLSKQVQTTAENQARLEELLDVLGGELQNLFERVAGLERMPELARQLIEESRERDAAFRDAVGKLDAVAKRFDHLEELSEQILAAGRTTHAKLDDIAAVITTRGAVQLQQEPDGEWRGVCPTCRGERRFLKARFLESRSTGKSLAAFFFRDFLNPANYVRAFTGVKYAAKVGCEACKYPLVVCGNCRQTFSGNPNDTLRQCPNCKTWNDG